MDQVVKSLADEKESLRAEVNAIRESEEELTHVLQIYEETISELIAEKKKELEWFDMERGRLQEELDQALQDLRNIEAAYANFHRKFERTIFVGGGF